jgi:hypothetical protein
LRVYWHAQDAIVRCPGCESVMLRLVRVRGELCLDFTGTTRLRIPVG